MSLQVSSWYLQYIYIIEVLNRQRYRVARGDKEDPHTSLEHNPESTRAVEGQYTDVQGPAASVAKQRLPQPSSSFSFTLASSSGTAVPSVGRRQPLPVRCLLVLTAHDSGRSSQHLWAQDPAPARQCGTEGRTGHNGREGGNGDWNRGGGGDEDGNEKEDGNGHEDRDVGENGSGNGDEKREGGAGRESLGGPTKG